MGGSNITPNSSDFNLSESENKTREFRCWVNFMSLKMTLEVKKVSFDRLIHFPSLQ